MALLSILLHGQDRVLKTDGLSISGKIVLLDQSNGIIKIRTDQGVVEIGLDQLKEATYNGNRYISKMISDAEILLKVAIEGPVTLLVHPSSFYLDKGGEITQLKKVLGGGTVEVDGKVFQRSEDVFKNVLNMALLLPDPTEMRERISRTSLTESSLSKVVNFYNSQVDPSYTSKKNKAEMGFGISAGMSSGSITYGSSTGTTFVESSDLDTSFNPTFGVLGSLSLRHNFFFFAGVDYESYEFGGRTKRTVGSMNYENMATMKVDVIRPSLGASWRILKGPISPYVFVSAGFPLEVGFSSTLASNLNDAGFEDKEGYLIESYNLSIRGELGLNIPGNYNFYVASSSMGMVIDDPNNSTFVSDGTLKSLSFGVRKMFSTK